MKLSIMPLLIFAFATWGITKTTCSVAQETGYMVVYQDLDWSPDGSEISFSAMKIKNDYSDYSLDKWGLFIFNLNNGKLSKIDDAALHMSYSPDGKQIAYDKMDGEKRHIYLWNTETGKSRQLLEGEENVSAPSWSPDGKSLVFNKKMNNHPEVFILDLISNKVSQVTHSNESSCYNPIFSPGSDLIVYFLEKGDGKDQIYLTDSEGSFNTNLTNDDHHNIYPFWTKDGRIIYSRDNGELMIMNKDGSGKSNFVKDLQTEHAKLSPNGVDVLYASNQGLKILNLKDGSERLAVSSRDIK